MKKKKKKYYIFFCLNINDNKNVIFFQNLIHIYTFENEIFII